MTPFTSILWPMAALALLTFVVLLIMPFLRVGDVAAGRAKAADFRYGESEDVPWRTRLFNRNYMNLLELPVLFYAACLIAFVTDDRDALPLGLAWAFVGFRVLHTLVHVSLNPILIRMALFAASAMTLLALWVAIFWRLAQLG
ncbi:MAG: MAPEG family protein [Asticcacaulis sp.]|uniref:MAPEG family protein n=1 Tax=Asticcacaulis sp. TaxID=1872648 RepID=UPI003F7B7BBE